MFRQSLSGGGESGAQPGPCQPRGGGEPLAHTPGSSCWVLSGATRPQGPGRPCKFPPDDPRPRGPAPEPCGSAASIRSGHLLSVCDFKVNSSRETGLQGTISLAVKDCHQTVYNSPPFSRKP